MKPLDEILYSAIVSDAELMTAVGGRVKSTCFEVSPDEQDNTPLPCIIITDNGSQAQPETKDCEWEPSEDRVQAAVEVSADSPRAVRDLITKCRRAVAAYVSTLADTDPDDLPMLESIQRDGTAWDWMKPCYFDTLRYQCTVYNS